LSELHLQKITRTEITIMNDLQAALLQAGLTTPAQFAAARKEARQLDVQNTARLRPDKWYRGPHSIHVHRHPKLGKHCTIIKSAVPLINGVLALRALKRVHLGQIYNTPAIGKRGLWITKSHKKSSICLVIGDVLICQKFRLVYRSRDGRRTLIAKLCEIAAQLNFPAFLPGD
jgi:hypothetical protein